MHSKKKLDRKQIDMNFKTKSYLSNGRMVERETIYFRPNCILTNHVYIILDKDGMGYLYVVSRK